jgi:hypothetical protein
VEARAADNDCTGLLQLFHTWSTSTWRLAEEGRTVGGDSAGVIDQIFDRYWCAGEGTDVFAIVEASVEFNRSLGRSFVVKRCESIEIRLSCVGAFDGRCNSFNCGPP